MVIYKVRGKRGVRAQPAEPKDAPNDSQPRLEQRWACIHRGEKIRIEECQLCSRKGKQEPVYSCAIWGECTIRRFRRDLIGQPMPEICRDCKTRVAPDSAKAKERDMLTQAVGGGFHGMQQPPQHAAEAPKRSRAERIAARNARIAARKARQGDDRATELVEQAKVPELPAKAATSRQERAKAREDRKRRRERERLALGGEYPPVAHIITVDDPLQTYSRDGAKLEGHPLRNLWAGCAAFYVCGGPSLREIDLSFLKDRGIVSLGINNVAGYAPVRAWTFSDPASKFSSDIFLDPAILKFVPVPKLGERVRARRDGKFAWTPYEVKHCPSVFGYNRQTLFDPQTFLTSEQASWGRSKKHKQNEGKTTVLFTFLLGLRLLHYLGVRRVYLLGVDFKMTETAHYAFGQDRHSGAVASNNNSYRVATELCGELRPVFDKAGFEVYQTNEKSALRVFDYLPLADAIDDCRGVIPQEPWPADSMTGFYDKPNVDGDKSDDRGEE